MTYTPAMPPRDHQKEGIRKSWGKNAFAWFVEMGGGKTKIMLDEFGYLEDRGSVQDLLVVAPGSVYQNWYSKITGRVTGEIPKHWDPELVERAKFFVWEAGPGVRKTAEMENFLRNTDPRRPRVLLMNIESMGRVALAKEVAQAFLEAPGRRSMFNIDESTIIKNHKSSQGKEALRLAPFADYRRIAAGMPSPKSPMDLYSQFQFLSPTIFNRDSFFSFQGRYAKTKKIKMGTKTNKRGLIIPNEFTKVVGYQNMNELRQIIEPWHYRKLKSECLDLPPKIYMEPRVIKLTDEQRRIYAEVKRYAISELSNGAIVTAPRIITQMLRLHQVLLGHVVDSEGNEHDVAENRSAELMHMLEDFGGKAIIWAPYVRTIDKLRDTLRKEWGPESTVTFIGKDNDRQRQENEWNFQNNAATRFMLSNQQTGARGRTWTAASAVIYYGNLPDLELRMQSEDRAHRDGLQHPVSYQDMMAEGTTVETRFLDILRGKLDLTSEVTGDAIKEWVI